MAWVDLENGGQLWYEDLGEGPAIVLLHGWCMSSAVWRFQMENLCNSFRLIAPDLRGHGQSPASFGYCDFSGFSADLCELFQRLELTDAFLVGWSMGVQLALSVFTSLRERLSGLVLVSGTPRFISTGDYPHGLDAVEIAGMEVKVRRNPARALERFVADMFTDGELEDCDRGECIRKLFAVMPVPDRRVAVESLRALGGADMRELLSTIDLPTLIVNGDLDRICLPGASAYMVHRIAASVHVVFKGCGHAPFLSRSNEFNDTIAGFCRRTFAQGK